MSQSRLSRGRRMSARASGSNGVSRVVPRNMFSGRVFHPSEAPPVFSGQPWNQIQLVVPSPAEVKISTIKGCLASQSGCANSDFEFRIQSFAVWSDATKFGVSPIDYLRPSSDPGLELVNLVSNSMKNAYARVGYIYPQSHQQYVLYSKDTDRVLITVHSKAIEMHLKVLWRGADFKMKLIEEQVLCSGSSVCSGIEDLAVQARLANIERLLQDTRLNDG